ncbi:DUF4232 domain-containing protein [Nocardioides terrisoli]|uniref:DUF4232 domain-containing protein n=1 Tax=Nocardioides terrisoli TaxID=3388267 RepID=UPI00287B63F8|nr:DUF4232 domain-containing protein [Nocardioides marmorisolisilvae]
MSITWSMTRPTKAIHSRGLRVTVAALALAAGSVATTAAAPATASPTASASGPVAHCRNADLKVSYRHAVGGDGMNQHWGWIIIRNRSHHRCATGGYGGISYVGHGNGTQIGAAATRLAPAPRTFIVKPGHALRSAIDEINASVYDHSRCRPRHVDGFRVYVPNATRSQYVPHPTTGCANRRVHLLMHRAYRRP